MRGLLVMSSATQRLICKEKCNVKRRKKMLFCVSCQTERRGKQKSRIVLGGRQRESIFLFHDLSAMPKSPSYDHPHCRCTNYSSCTTHSFSRKFWALLWKPNQWSTDTITQPLSSSASLLYAVRRPELLLFLLHKHILCSTMFVYFSGRTEGSKGGACQTPVAPLLLLLQGFPVLSSPSAQGNIWIQDLSIFPANKMY